MGTNEELIGVVFEDNPIPMWIFDAGTLRFLVVNQAAIHHYGYSREEFLAMSIRDIRPTEDVPAMLRDILEPLSIAPIRTWRHVKKDGTVIAVDVTAHGVVYDGRPARLVVAHDVTRRQQLEQQIAQGQKMEAIGQLAGGIAHDFNNLLTVILSYGDLALHELAPNDRAREHVEQMRHAGERASELTRRLLAFSRHDVGDAVPVDLAALVRDLDRMLSRVLGDRIALETTAPVAAWVRADPGQLERVLLNLVMNARDAMPAGGTIRVAVEPISVDAAEVAGLDAPAGPCVRLTVRDDGLGMDERVRARAFEPFFTTKELGRGTGLGLSTVFGIVKRSAGAISIESALGRGSTFTIVLPRIPTPATPPVSKTRTAPAPPSGDETILLVEDEPQVRALVREYLIGRGYAVVDAPDGVAALEASQAHAGPIHLLLSDVVMPRLNGIEVARRLLTARPGLRVLFMTGYAPVSPSESVPGAAHVEKPIALEALARRVREVLDGPAPKTP